MSGEDPDRGDGTERPRATDPSRDGTLDVPTPDDWGPEFDLVVEAPPFWGTEREKPLTVVALGGNAIDPPDSDGTFADQMAAVERTAARVADLMKAGYKVVLTHGNGPQVGSLLLQQEQGEPPAQPLEICGAMTQGQIGYMLVQAMYRQLERRWKHVPAAAIVTQTIVDPDDPAMDDPTKPIGPYVDAERAEEMREQGMAVTKVRDTGDRDYRRVVPSPEPKGIVEETPVKRLIDQRDLVICGGGGGVPVARERGRIDGFDAVVDKDLLANVIAHRLNADNLLVLTDVDGVYRDYGTPEAERIETTTASELRDLADAGEFPEGSMGPKVEAACRFVEAESRRERRAVIAALDDAKAALDGDAGTTVVEN